MLCGISRTDVESKPCQSVALIVQVWSATLSVNHLRAMVRWITKVDISNAFPIRERDSSLHRYQAESSFCRIEFLFIVVESVFHKNYMIGLSMVMQESEMKVIAWFDHLWISQADLISVCLSHRVTESLSDWGVTARTALRDDRYILSPALTPRPVWRTQSCRKMKKKLRQRSKR